MTLWLTDAQVQQLIDHARADAPNEACGLIAGKGMRAVRIIPLENVAETPQTNYVANPRQLVQQIHEIEAAGLSLIAVYHSHPRHAAIPSETDIRQATYGATPYLIVGLQGDTPTLAAWTIQHGRVTPVYLHIGLNEPDTTTQDTPLSQAQQAAILISTALAFALLILFSLALLPPAPSIP
ncbi:MAG: M67 family metallopeptidase [bacterium]|nr:M67 family metallopeptidase [bacterium]